MTTSNSALSAWVNQVAQHTLPERIHWCDGSGEENDTLISAMLADSTLLPLKETFPNCYLHRSDPNDVARVEHLTYICTENETDAGPNNNWMAPAEAHRLVDGLFAGCMRGRTMYVIPYCMGPIDSPYSRCGVEITDSPYVVANMRIMTRMGQAALERIEREGTFVRGLHSIGELDPDKRYIMHFPAELTIKSIGSGYGGNALLGKKCHALRIASHQARTEGWLAEHMLILGLQDPTGRIFYIAGAFPSQCGKTNLAMLVPPESLERWRVWTVGDDIAWLHPGEDGRLYAINPESGFFGVVPGTSRSTNRNAFDMIHHDTIFTNVGVTADNEPWWEGRKYSEPALDWQGKPMNGGPAAHPNSRFTVSARQNRDYTPIMDDPRGVPISAIVFGGRRRKLAPLVYQARDWQHGVLIGAGVASETTAAATGEVGVVRRDPMAMKPFCGYNFADYWSHWLAIGKKLKQPPAMFHVNWFRKNDAGEFLWPGFGDNLRVLSWIVDRCHGAGAAVETPIGHLPTSDALDIGGLDIADGALRELLTVDNASWREEMVHLGEYLESYGDRLPQALRDEHARVSAALAD
ncbi:MAG: phosphoenolpyruvate carboxykinase (GTP) [Gammaproteobacteria bacterium]|nr:phosphoenolpyruvate carboxykinase (GTP) [Gammaproteobacteria bacterium]NNF59858.1 phosphoenolpyruvate carboxykinase (GTP) [Gammaproteobacteria bacterium]NNM21268.1 phosphoenolpyruvate carboxykinase (GTP) [Gammaproteobacteria bacterium]